MEAKNDDRRATGICPVCGTELDLSKIEVGAFEDDCYCEGYVHNSFECPHCKAAFECEVPEGEVDPGYPRNVSDQGFGKCPYCGGVICWCGDFMRSDFEGVDLPEDDDAIVRSLACSKCGVDFTVYEPTPNEIKINPNLNS